MKILVFSDTHLEKRFDQKKYNFLVSIIKEADQVIINGDFWEGYTTSFNSFINSEWRKLFPLLKQKQAIYIFGNHDKAQWNDPRDNLFSDKQLLNFTLRSGNKTFIFEHGDRFDYAFKRSRYFHRIYLVKLFSLTEKIMVRVFAGKLFNLTGKRFNRRATRFISQNLKSNEIFICGHTHMAELNETKGFVNSGMIRYGLGQYLMIEDGKIHLHQKLYRKSPISI